MDLMMLLGQVPPHPIHSGRTVRNCGVATDRDGDLPSAGTARHAPVVCATGETITLPRLWELTAPVIAGATEAAPVLIPDIAIALRIPSKNLWLRMRQLEAEGHLRMVIARDRRSRSAWAVYPTKKGKRK